MKKIMYFVVFAFIFASCGEEKTADTTPKETKKEGVKKEAQKNPIKEKIEQYVPVKLTTDISKLTDSEKKIIPLLIEAADIMNDLFWYEAYGDKNELFAKIKDEDTKRFAEINYGPWDRLGNNEPFVQGIGPKPAGANYYPVDMTKEEFKKSPLKEKESLYTFLRRDKDGTLITVPYHVQFNQPLRKVSSLLLEAAAMTENKGFKRYLTTRAKALLSDEYRESDLLWMDMKTNHLDIVIGPIETYEDQLFGIKASHEGYVLVKDMEWSKKLAHFIKFLPELQRGLPVDDKYKAEKPGTDSDLNAYDVIYYAGDCNAGGKTIAINLPNDESVQLEKGTRRLQLKNAMKAKFDNILVPIADLLIDPTQRKHVTFDAFFANTMFHEVAHGLGIKKTINGKGMVRKSLGKYASSLEEGKADILGLYMVMQLHEKGELKADMRDYMTTFVASIFRSIRFGASSAHGKANMIRFNFFKANGAFTRNENGTYTINYDKMEEAMNKLSRLILTLQGNSDFEGVAQLIKEKGIIKPELQGDLDRLMDAKIPVDVVFDQGVKVLGL